MDWVLADYSSHNCHKISYSSLLKTDTSRRRLNLNYYAFFSKAELAHCHAASFVTVCDENKVFIHQDG